MSDITIDHRILLKNAEGENLEPYVTTASVLNTESNLPVQNAPVANRFRDILYFDVIAARNLYYIDYLVGISNRGSKVAKIGNKYVKALNYSTYNIDSSPYDTNGFYESTDGETWTQVTCTLDKSTLPPTDVEYCNELIYFVLDGLYIVAVTKNSNLSICWSTDNVTWNSTLVANTNETYFYFRDEYNRTFDPILVKGDDQYVIIPANYSFIYGKLNSSKTGFESWDIGSVGSYGNGFSLLEVLKSNDGYYMYSGTGEILKCTNTEVPNSFSYTNATGSLPGYLNRTQGASLDRTYSSVNYINGVLYATRKIDNGGVISNVIEYTNQYETNFTTITLPSTFEEVKNMMYDGSKFYVLDKRVIYGSTDLTSFNKEFEIDLATGYPELTEYYTRNWAIHYLQFIDSIGFISSRYVVEVAYQQYKDLLPILK